MAKPHKILWSVPRRWLGKGKSLNRFDALGVIQRLKRPHQIVVLRAIAPLLSEDAYTPPGPRQTVEDIASKLQLGTGSTASLFAHLDDHVREIQDALDTVGIRHMQRGAITSAELHDIATRHAQLQKLIDGLAPDEKTARLASHSAIQQRRDSWKAGWEFSGQLDHTIAAIPGFNSASRPPMSEVYEQWKDDWETHITSSRDFLLTATARLSHRGSIAVVGAGHCHDCPLQDLVNKLSETHLLDVDRRAIEYARQSIETHSRDKISNHAMDATGLTSQLIVEVRKILEDASDPETALEQLVVLAENAHLKSFPSLLPEGRQASIAFSNMIFSQLHLYSMAAVEALFNAKFPDADCTFSYEWTLAADQILRRLGYEHLQLLAQTAPRIVVISDVDQWSTISFFGDARAAQSRIIHLDLLHELEAEHQLVNSGEWVWDMWPARGSPVAHYRQVIAREYVRKPA
jgi:hypothetical protein